MNSERIAIVGLGGVFPGAPEPSQFRTIVENGVCMAGPVPPGRWAIDPADALAPGLGVPDRVPSDRGCYVAPVRFDPSGTGLEADDLDRLDPMFHLALEAGWQCWRDARTDRLDRARVAVIMGNIALPTESASKLAGSVLGRTLAERWNLPPGPFAEPFEPRNAYVAGLPAGLLAQSLGLGGGAYTLDAACASSLYAVALAAEALRSGRVDAVLAGGLSRPDPLYTQMGFSQLRALSQKGLPRPFDAEGDGLVVGEGCGLFLLKRLGDALAQGDRIYGVLAGAGLSNDVDGGLLAPSSEGQLRAMRAAYAQAGWDPQTVDLIECHATGTPVGDAVEFASLRTLWGDSDVPPGRCVLGSVKSNIGHALTAAGAAGLLKLLLALKHRTLPPTANFRAVSPKIELENSPFVVLNQARPWAEPPDGRPRRAAISGFGFGGINAHLLIEEFVPGRTAVRATLPIELRPNAESPIAVVGLAARFGSCANTQSVQEAFLGGKTPEPQALTSWWGVDTASWFRTGFEGKERLGHALGEHVLPADRFRIPPKELEESLPQQTLMLEVAADAAEDAGWRREDGTRPRVGVFVGIGLDLNTTNYHVRWALGPLARTWAEHLGLDSRDEAVEGWVHEVRRAYGPPLTANRTMGALGSIVASRIAREFRLGGPSFTVSSEETSGARAVEVAVRLLRDGTLDGALVGAVDLPSDVRTTLAAGRTGSDVVPCDGAAALVLKRWDDALRDGDTIHAVIRGVGASTGRVGDAPTESAYVASLDRATAEAGVEAKALDLIVTDNAGRSDAIRRQSNALQTLAGRTRSEPAALANADRLGHAGAASAMVGLVGAIVALRERMLPPWTGATAPTGYVLPRGPQSWLHDRADGPRRAAVASQGIDGTCLHLILDEPPAQASRVDPQPLGARPAALFAVEGDEPTEVLAGLAALGTFVERASGDSSIESLARVWQTERSRRPIADKAVALVASSPAELLESLDQARARIAHDAPARPGSSIHWSPKPLGPGGLAFVYPGMGNHFAGMDRELSAHFPEVFRRLDAEDLRAGSQMAPGVFWNADPPATFSAHVAPILGQVTLGIALTDLFRDLGIRPEAAIGYSLGESTALFALRAWTERDAMLGRLEASPLFRTELAGPCDTARRAWRIPPEVPVDWIVGIVPESAGTIGAAIGARTQVYVLIVNSPAECVIGGRRDAVLSVVRELGGRFLPLPVVSTVHCEVAAQVAEAYRELHLLTTTPPPGIRFSRGHTGTFHVPDRESAAEAIVEHAVHGVDYPKVIERAYADGLRIFLEVGPGNSCSRLIGRILGHRPHRTFAACVPGAEPIRALLDVLAGLIAERVPVDLDSLYGRERPTTARLAAPVSPARRIRIPVGGPPFGDLPPPTRPRTERPAKVRVEPKEVPIVPTKPVPAFASIHQFPPIFHEDRPVKSSRPEPEAMPLGTTAIAIESPAASFTQVSPSMSREPSPVALPTLVPVREMVVGTEILSSQATSLETAQVQAHEAFLKLSSRVTRSLSIQMAFQMALAETLLAVGGEVSASNPLVADVRISEWPVTFESEVVADPFEDGPPRSLNRKQCLEFAIGAIGDVLGPEFAAVDANPTRVRLPDEPLMLVDRILTIEGEPRSMTSGRVVTEHDIHPGAWYLDCGRIPTCIAVESGQADLFLSGYLGIDFITKGQAVYRLLDAVVTFHSALPGPGAVIHYDIHIDRFFRQGETYLFRFRFEGTVDGEPLLTMRDGCAGFFTEAELAAGQGVIQTELQKRPMPGIVPKGWTTPADMIEEGMDESRVEALRRGDYVAAFGATFAGLTIEKPLGLPGGRMTLVHRVASIEPKGGRFRLGRIRAEADIHPDDWFMTCHFVDDQVMPGTLMFECCLHTLRIHLMRMGWIGEADNVACEPVPGVSSRLKCRGQVIASTKVVTYEVTIKELGYRPEPYAIADALMYTDGKPIVEITDMSLRFTGWSRESVEAVWASRSLPTPRKPALFDCDSILAFAVGKPSEAFGDRYQVFDTDRVIARLPGPPYQFLDRITRIEGCEPWVLAAGGRIEAEYDVPRDAWYFAAERQDRMPFAVLLEVALQPCGWLAAYLGSALTSDTDLSFRNLGGTATQFVPVTSRTGTLTTVVNITKVARSGGMIIQNFDYEVRAGDTVVYRGDTYFGFFSKAALAQQVGIRDAVPYRPSDQERFQARRLDFPTDSPFPDRRMRMIDRIAEYLPTGGPHGLGYIRGEFDVDPSAWFFKAHFHQDPVCPGSLGLESLLQLLKFVASERWGDEPKVGVRPVFESIGLNAPHAWTYRGQVVPHHRLVGVRAVVTAIDDVTRTLRADGFLEVDGRVIYGMNDFTLRWDSEPSR